MREKTGAWAPDIVAGEEGSRGEGEEATNAAFSSCWGEQLWGQGGKGKFFCKEITLFPAFS